MYPTVSNLYNVYNNYCLFGILICLHTFWKQLLLESFSSNYSLFCPQLFLCMHLIFKPQPFSLHSMCLHTRLTQLVLLLLALSYLFICAQSYELLCDYIVVRVVFAAFVYLSLLLSHCNKLPHLSVLMLVCLCNKLKYFIVSICVTLFVDQQSVKIGEILIDIEIGSHRSLLGSVVGLLNVKSWFKPQQREI